MALAVFFRIQSKSEVDFFNRNPLILLHMALVVVVGSGGDDNANTGNFHLDDVFCCTISSGSISYLSVE